MMKEYNIGNVIELEVVESIICGNCIFDCEHKDAIDMKRMKCNSVNRTDNKNIIYKLKRDC